ncbi:uS17 family ribosomal protein [Aspergillus lucknowensis]|uniref:Nucleic acid-binding protein n=1 Tax=Aspergillus lucknowensis TaxID=176173 RepID=A0ABR4LZ99_9EURO
MSQSHLLRALRPLRSSTIQSASVLFTQTHNTLQCGKSSFILRRLITYSSARAPQQQNTQQVNTAPSAVPPSLRKYPYTLKTGTVVSVGRMDRTVRVEHRHTIWDSYLHKSYPKVTTYLVSDPRNSLREGDVIEFSSGYPKSRWVHHVVERIIAPFGEAIEDRPPVMLREERDALRAEKRAAKVARREQRRGESGATLSGDGRGQEHVGRIRRLVLERTTRQRRPSRSTKAPSAEDLVAQELINKGFTAEDLLGEATAAEEPATEESRSANPSTEKRG